MNDRHFSLFDRLITQFDQALHTVCGPTPAPGRVSPAAGKNDISLTASERELAGRLMRINHVGEICAQALYQGQAVSAQLPDVREKMEQAAQEENDHLAWTGERIRELDSHASYLNPLWYAGSFAIGAVAGAIGDRWSLGFVAETEKQVVAHLNEHLQRLPETDEKSRAILEQMRDDEGRHATVAIESGGAALPEPIRQCMRYASKIMVRTAYWI
ncbi:MAG: 2-polyprenyl-3-methyl-6-methoxy-1,4-benzoquinone monooxygenase [Sulfuricaulis sp.]